MKIPALNQDVHSMSGASRRTVLLLVLLALVLSVGRVGLIRSDRAFVGQGFMYKEVARALASGQGYIETHTGSWQGHPTMRRPPLWPLFLSLPLRLCPQCGSIAVTQYSTAVMHAVTAIAGALLVWFLSGSMRRMIIALLAITLFPPVQPLLMGGYCEPLSAAVLVIGILLLCLGRRYFFAGAIVLSFLPLVRPNFLPLWASLTVLAWWLQSHHPSLRIFGSTRRLVAAGLLFYTPTLVWLARNYLVSGAPIIAGTSSMTFYGNYNSISGTIGPEFARWISPEKIPGDHGVKSEAEEFRYYDTRGNEFIRQHWKIVPLMMAAHVAFSLLPSPADGAHKYSFWLIRCAIYGAALLAIRRRMVTVESWFGALVFCTILSTIITVVLYSGEGRYLYPQDIVMLVLVCSARYQKPNSSAAVREGTAVTEAQPQPTAMM